MTIHVYRSDDAGAPVLNGVAGSLIGVLDACLVNGYGSQAAAGWAKAFSGTNLAAYRAAVGNRMYLRVDDTPAQHPRLRGYEVMTDVNTGTGLFPTDGQLSGGGYVLKSSTANATARPWIVIADEQAVYMWIGFGITDIASPAAWSVGCWFFGDIVSYKAGDAFGTALVTRNTISTDSVPEQLFRLSILSTAQAGHFMSRNSAGIAGAVTCNEQAVMPGSQAFCGAGGSVYPDLVTGRMNLARIPIAESTGYTLRGHLPGAFNPLHNSPGSHLDTITGLDGETYLVIYIYYTSGTGRAVIQITGSWRT